MKNRREKQILAWKQSAASTLPTASSAASAPAAIIPAAAATSDPPASRGAIEASIATDFIIIN